MEEERRAATLANLTRRIVFSGSFFAMSGEHYMRTALELAARGRGKTSPNPMVGAVLVSEDRVVGQGYHLKAGEPHAEVLALREGGTAARGADLYVTLEPCSHYGRTPPCTASIVKAGVARVIVATVDPDPRVNGAGIAALRGAGVEVTTSLLENEARRLNEAYFKRVTTGLPFVTLKLAVSLDGKVAAATGDACWISNEEARQRVHRLRAEVDAVMVGAGTVTADDPLLTARPSEGTDRQPLRVVLDGRLRCSPRSRVYGGEAPTLVFSGIDADEDRAVELRRRGVRVERLRRLDKRLPLREILSRLGAEGVTHLLCEGGGRLAASLLSESLVDRLMVFVAPVLIGGESGGASWGGDGAQTMRQALRLTDMSLEMVGDNALFEGGVPASLARGGR